MKILARHDNKWDYDDGLVDRMSKWGKLWTKVLKTTPYGALGMLVLLHFHKLGFTPVQIAFI